VTGVVETITGARSSGRPISMEHQLTMNHPSPAPLRLENRHTGEVLELRRQKRNGEVVLELRGTLPAHREGPPLHIHHVEDEEGLITAGTLSVQVDGKRLDAGPGQTVRLPRGIPHRWWNEGDQPLAFEGCTRPVVDLDRYLQAVFEVMNAGAPNRPPLFYLAHVALRHRRTQTVLVMPAPVQTVLFRVAVALGTIFGRYRGTEWPGCPARCTGAPEAVTEDV
jgi:mannose-6-phosphate isomerase-like protein (cupin superfamily)